jgi:UDP-N-acetylglucosamine:LPS N-acetylglucosamine transferase
MANRPCRNAIDRLVRQKDGKLKLRRQLDKPVVLVLGTGWGAQSLIKVWITACRCYKLRSTQQVL